MEQTPQESSSLRPTPLPLHCECDRDSCNGEVVEIVTPCAREIFIRCDPASISTEASPPWQQAQRFYECLPWILQQANADMGNVVLERAFFRDLTEDFEAFADARRDAYRRGGVSDDLLPVASYVGQPPCVAGQAFELQVYAVIPKSPQTASVRSIPGTATLPPAKVVEIGGYRHLYVRNVTGRGGNRQPAGTFRKQSDAMFARAAELLQRQGATFENVLRTWCYLADIQQDYDEFNASRNAFFQHQQLQRLPASTGICACLYPPGTQCGMDCYALLNPEGAKIEVMHTPTLNEAPEYGSSFSRGMKVTLPEKTVLFVSGTASVDERGATAHVGDVRGQIERMLLNVEQLLAPHGATFAQLVQTITYLKSASYLDLFREIARDRGLVQLPNTIVQADICRPELLCEMEAIAILPHNQRRS